ncbi:hypothetical protein N0V83_001821 [Neocucurbitaria cava]|uniref:Uncharacterized protein n=1 Tax=Neocucurbitaria cava TaxID=798079 RepID=A0A9W8YFV0_9PLEO|nr:hypothetical protein N0V83_001821 [Neocucurbitaria cava]
MAISASVIQVMGLIPPYFELAKRNGRVIGINFWFLTIDYAGAFFSLMAVETGIFLSQAIWLWRVRHIRREAKKVGLMYDQYIAKNPSKKLPRSDSQDSVVDVEACHGHNEPNTYNEKVETTSINNTCTTGLQDSNATSDTTTTTEKETLPKPPPVAVLKSTGSD